MDAIDFSSFCECAQRSNMDAGNIRMRIHKINLKLRNLQQKGGKRHVDTIARHAVYVIRDMAEGLEKVRDNNSALTALCGATEVLAAVLSRLSDLGIVGSDFLGLAAAIFTHFSPGREHCIQTLLADCVTESKEFITDTELITSILEVEDQLVHQSALLAAVVPSTVAPEEVPAFCANIPPYMEIRPLRIIEERIPMFFRSDYWRTTHVNNGLTFVRLYAQIMTLRLVLLCGAYDVISQSENFPNVARGYKGAMLALLAISKEVFGFFRTGEYFSITSCVGQVEWPAVYSFLGLLGDDRSQCGDWVFNDPGPPDDALAVGRSRPGGEVVYIGRTEFRAELVVGKIYGRKMLWSSDGVEYTTTNSNEYEILCISDRRVHALWRKNVGGDPENLGAYRAGRGPDGSTYYVGRGAYKGELLVGKVVGGQFFAAAFGNELVENDPDAYEVLCLASR